MRTTVRIDDDLMHQLKQRADAAGESVTRVLNRLLRSGIAAEENGEEQKKKAFKQRTYSMGVPLVDVTKAIHLCYAEDDAKIIEMMRSPGDRSQASEQGRETDAAG